MLEYNIYGMTGIIERSGKIASKPSKKNPPLLLVRFYVVFQSGGIEELKERIGEMVG